MLSAVGVIPARYGSSRLPGKPLADLQGKPLLYHVFHRASRAASLDRVLIATDDQRVLEAARAFGAPVVMTRSDHRSGTDRIAEALAEIPAEVVVNIQGDEPLIDFSAIDQVVGLLKGDPDSQMTTLMSPITNVKELMDPNVVKVVVDTRGYALYFSRSPIPFVRVKGASRLELPKLIEAEPELLIHFHRHVGLYAYRSGFLREFTQWEPSPLELVEDLEQLRAIEHGAKIKVGISSTVTLGIDTPEDLTRIRELIEKHPELLNV